MSETTIAPHRYAVFGPGMSGTTNDIEEVKIWLSNNPQAQLYSLVAPGFMRLRKLAEIAEKEDECEIGVGGLAVELGLLTSPPASTAPARACE